MSIANPWVILAFIVALGASALAGFGAGDHWGSQGVQAKWDKAEKERAWQSQRNGERTREAEQTLQAKADKQRTEDAQAIADLSTRVAALDERLRKRPARPEPAAVGAQDADAGTDLRTGAGLYREDGMFLVGEAAAARRIVVQRDTCYRLYGEAQAALEALGQPVKGQQPAPGGAN